MATIIRGKGDRSASSASAPRHATFTFSDMASQGDHYVASVRAEAAKAVQEANIEADAIRRRAESEGRASAEAAIKELLSQQVGQEMKSLRPALNAVVAELHAARGEWLEHWRSAAIRVAVAVAERIVRRELSADPTISEAWVTEALELSVASSDITVRLSPTDYEHLRDHAESVAASLGRVGEARVVADENVSPGGCRVDTQHGSIDQRLETQLERLTEELG